MENMEKLVINATPRSVTGKQVGALRRQGKLPGVIYGHRINPTPIMMDEREATRVLAHATASSLITINLEGEEQSALVREIQRNFIRRSLLHVDFLAVSLTEKIRARVGIELSGDAPAVKDFNAFIVTSVSEVEVEGYPQDLPQVITVDISSLAAIGDNITVRDLKVSDKVTVLTDLDEIVAVATPAGQEEEVAEAAAAEAEPEVIEKGKKEEEEA
jgi:large subunit ribosomal protein L25